MDPATEADLIIQVTDLTGTVNGGYLWDVIDCRDGWPYTSGWARTAELAQAAARASYAEILGPDGLAVKAWH